MVAAPRGRGLREERRRLRSSSLRAGSRRLKVLPFRSSERKFRKA
jgi:hypothetical protein